jgi:hypothetical protein
MKDEATTTTPTVAIGTNIDVDVKIKMLHTIAQAIYATPVGKIREAVANAVDNVASWVLIVADRTTKTLCIYDNGQGISISQFEEIFQSIGYGLSSDDPDKKLSYFGLGFMSIFRLGKKVKIFTRPKDDQHIIAVDINAKEIFSPDNQKKSIKELRNYITFGNPDDRKISSAPMLEDLIMTEFGGLPLSFTEIVIEGIDDEDKVCDPSFSDELRRVLPLRAALDEPFFDRFIGKKGEDIREILANPTFCPTIDVYFGIRGEPNETVGPEEEIPEVELKKLWKYFPSFRADLKFADPNIYLGYSEEGDFAYYFIHTIAQDFYRGVPDRKENGFWVRNHNFLVKPSDFLGPGRKIIDAPLKNWLFGEICHKDMNEFLNVSRNDYLFDKGKFCDFRERIAAILDPLNNILRKINERKKHILSEVIDPFKNIAESNGSLKKAEQRLHRIVKAESEAEFNDEIFRRLRKQRREEIESPEAQVDIVLAKTTEPLQLGSEDEGLAVYIDPNVKKDEDFLWESEKQVLKVSISPEIFNPKNVVFLGKTFKVVFVVKSVEDYSISFDIDKNIIYINPFSKELSVYSLTVLEAIIAIEVAEAMAGGDAKELKRYFLLLIGATETLAKEYITPLGDDLRRTLAFKGFGR